MFDDNQSTLNNNNDDYNHKKHSPGHANRNSHHEDGVDGDISIVEHTHEQDITNQSVHLCVVDIMYSVSYNVAMAVSHVGRGRVISYQH